jgi:hypothetical protein
VSVAMIGTVAISAATVAIESGSGAVLTYGKGRQ